ncbi:MAG: DUF975 family protein [Eubacteriales bacterium]|nr:DUF975 family protein [Eubacteriales bacterium]
MKLARDYRESAWNILRGRYWWTVLAGLIASVLGGFGSGGSFNFDFNFHVDSGDFSHFVQRLTYGQIDVSQIYSMLRPLAGIAAALGGLFAAYGIAVFIVGSAVELGYDKFNLSMYESASAPKIETVFSRFSYFVNALLLRLLMFVKILLWALLFIIPGIVAAFRYSMAPYIMAENPDLSATEAIEESKRMMTDNKWRLFCLEFSFIGWWLLAALTGGIGGVFLRPYVKAAITAFYLDLTGRLASPSYSAPTSSGTPTQSPSPEAPKLGEGESDSREFI